MFCGVVFNVSSHLYEFCWDLIACRLNFHWCCAMQHNGVEDFAVSVSTRHWHLRFVRLIAQFQQKL